MGDPRRRARLIQLAAQRSIRPSARAIGEAAGIPERTMRDVMAGKPMSLATHRRLRDLFGTEDFEEAGNAQPEGAGRLREPGPRRGAGAGRDLAAVPRPRAGDQELERGGAAVPRGQPSTALVKPDDWHARRRAGLGSSEIAGVLGISPWSNAYSVWAEKLSGFSDNGGSERMRWGTLFEDTIMDEAARRLGVWITGRQVAVTHPAEPWAIAILDGTYAEPPAELLDAGVLEIKNTSDSRWSEVPVHYEAQVRWQMECADLDHAWIAALHAGHRLSLWHVGRDRELGERLIAVGRRFWTEHVQRGVPPPIDGDDRTTKAIARRYKAELHMIADLGPLAADVTRLREIRHSQAALKAEEKFIRNRVMAYMGPATEGQIGGEIVATYREQHATRIDIERLRDELPRVAEEYSRDSPSRPFRLAGGKDAADE